MKRRSFFRFIAVLPFAANAEVAKVATWGSGDIVADSDFTYNDTSHSLGIVEFATETPFDIEEIQQESQIAGFISVTVAGVVHRVPVA